MSGRCRAAVAVTYLAAVLACILLGFDYAGSIHPGWVLGLIALTLPWSIVSLVFLWGLIHGAGLEIYTVLYLAFAALNVFIGFKISAGSGRVPRPQSAP